MTAQSPLLRFGHRTAARTGAALLLAISLGLPAPALAQPNSADSERANLLFKKGKVAFNDGKYSDALRIYSEAWQLKQSPDIAANLAQTESELGKHRDAAEHFAFALAHLLPSSTDEQKKALAEGLELEKKEVGTLQVTLEPADAALSLDSTPVPLPTNGEIFVEPGEHRCSVTREGYDENTQSIKVTKGGSRVLWIKLNQAGTGGGVASGLSESAGTANAGTGGASATDALSSSSAPNADSGASWRRSMVPVVVGGALVVAGAAVGVGFLLAGNSKQKDADALKTELPGENACGTGTLYPSQCAALEDKNKAVDQARVAETIGFSVAGAALVGSALYLIWPRPSATARRWTPAFALAPGAGSVGLTGRF